MGDLKPPKKSAKHTEPDVYYLEEEDELWKV